MSEVYRVFGNENGKKMRSERSCGTTHTKLAVTDLCLPYRPGASIDMNSLGRWTLCHIAHVRSTHLWQLCPAGTLEPVWPDKQSEPTIKHDSNDVENALRNLT